MIQTFRLWTHTSDDSYIYQLSLVVATATVSYQVSTLMLDVSHAVEVLVLCLLVVKDSIHLLYFLYHAACKVEFQPFKRLY